VREIFGYEAVGIEKRILGLIERDAVLF